MQDVGLLLLRLTVGGLLVGHGGQKLFGWFSGPGLEGVGGMMEKLGLQPGQRWAAIAGCGELGGGLCTALGFMHPVGPISMLAPMIVAWGKVHKDKPIWVQQGGAELPATNIAIAMTLALTGPGRYSVDRLLGLRAGPFVTALTAAAVAAGMAMVFTQPQPQPQQQPGGQAQPSTAESREPRLASASA